MKHLDEVGETYWQHFKFATGMALVLFITSILILIHAIYPGVFKTTGTNVLKHVNKRLEERSNGENNE